MFEVNATLKDNTTFIPDGYKTEYEAYSLQISMSKNANEGIVAQLNANYYPGYVRGLDSLFQLLETYDEQDGDDNSYMIRFLPINITDEPGFPYRGVMIDTSRQFYK